MSEEKFGASLDLAPLANAIARLSEGWGRYQKDITDTQVRDGLIQRFEFTYEISHKMLKRFLEATSPNPSIIDELSFQDLIRLGNERGLISGGWKEWRTFRDMRSRTSHTYNEDIALEVVEGVPAFQKEAAYLLEKLRGAQA